METANDNLADTARWNRRCRRRHHRIADSRIRRSGAWRACGRPLHTNIECHPIENCQVVHRRDRSVPGTVTDRG